MERAVASPCSPMLLAGTDASTPSWTRTTPVIHADQVTVGPSPSRDASCRRGHGRHHRGFSPTIGTAWTPTGRLQCHDFLRAPTKCEESPVNAVPQAPGGHGGGGPHSSPMSLDRQANTPKWRNACCTAAHQARISFQAPSPSFSEYSLMRGPSLPAWCSSASPATYLFSEQGLTHELIDFFHHVQLTAQESAARGQLLDFVRARVEELWPPSVGSAPTDCGSGAQLTLYGSYALGLSLPDSDIDLALSFPSEPDLQPTCHIDAPGSDAAAAMANQRQDLHLSRLHELAEHLRKSSRGALRVDVFDHCRVPRIHLQDWRHTAISCDISSSFTPGCLSRIVGRQRKWLRSSPLASFIICITKAAVRQWGLNKIFSGGLASAALYSLAARFLAHMEQLYQQTPVGENPSPPRYAEASAGVHPSNGAAPLSSPLPCSGLSLQAGSAVVSAPLASTAIPSYMPTWARRGARRSLTNTPAEYAREAEERGERTPVSPDSGQATPTHPTTAPAPSEAVALPLLWDDERGCRCSESKVTCDEADILAQEGLTHSSGATTAAPSPTACSVSSTPISPTATSMLSDLYSRLSESDPNESMKEEERGDHSAWNERAANPHPARRSDSVPSAEELIRIAQERFGVSPARLILRFWRFLSADVFLSGYQVADVFGDDTVWDEGNELYASSSPPPLPSASLLEQASFATTARNDISAASFRIPDLLALFRCSSASLENMLSFHHYPRTAAPTMLSTIFVDPRAPIH